VLRTLMNLDSTLERDLPEWRDRRILRIDPASVVSVKRAGSVVLDEGSPALDMTLEAGTTDSGWQASLPWNAAIDPGAIGGLISNACYLRARTFLADSAAQLSLFGLDQPDLRLELGLADGSEHVLLLRRDAQREGWLCMRAGSVHVYRVEELNIVFLAVPADGFLDTRLLRFERESVQRIELTQAQRRMTLRRDGPLWSLESELGASKLAAVRADSLVVSDLLGELEAARAVRYLVAEDAEPFVPGESPSSLRLVTANATLELEFGAARDAAPSVAGRMFRRAGENVAGIAEQRSVNLLQPSWEQLNDRQLIKLPEQGIARIELSRGPLQRSYERDASTGRWSVEGTQGEAPKPFLKCIEHLLSLRADVAIAGDAPFELSDAWNVLIVDGSGVRTAYRVGRFGPGGDRQGFDDGKRRGDVSSSGLWSDLEQIQ
jgi:hypothetical protein